jgi:uncharacterized cofD-like protein
VPNTPLRIVAVGGGTGLSSLLRGLKQYVTDPVPAFGGGVPALEPHVEITAVVTVTDDGGSSGRLRRQLEMLPPGDIRNCMVALSEDETLMARLFQYRFSAGRGLKGHSFGNLFLTALTQLTGDFAKAVAISAEVLATRGRIFPSTSTNVTLEAWLEDGSCVRGETKISRSKRPIERITLSPPDARPLPETLLAISEADLVCLGPGSLFTSVIPNLLVDGVVAAIRASGARTVYFVNLMWQPGETMHFKASDHVEAIHRHAGPRLVDTVVVNTQPIPAAPRKRYAAERAFPVENDIDRLRKMGLEVITGNFVARGDKIRHSPEAAAAVAVELARRSRQNMSRWRKASGA